MLHESRRQETGKAWKKSLFACLGLALLTPFPGVSAPVLLRPAGGYTPMARGNIAPPPNLDLHLSTASLTFTDNNPTSTSDISAQENPVTAFVSYTGPGILHIYFLANGNMTAAGDGPPVPAASVFWSGAGGGYESGRMSAVQAVEAACGRLASGPGGGWRFFLKRGHHDSGSYQLSITVMATVQ